MHIWSYLTAQKCAWQPWPAGIQSPQMFLWAKAQSKGAESSGRSADRAEALEPEGKPTTVYLCLPLPAFFYSMHVFASQSWGNVCYVTGVHRKSRIPKSQGHHHVLPHPSVTKIRQRQPRSGIGACTVESDVSLNPCVITTQLCDLKQSAYPLRVSSWRSINGWQ